MAMSTHTGMAISAITPPRAPPQRWRDSGDDVGQQHRHGADEHPSITT